jgi:hypothetical protein
MRALKLLLQLNLQYPRSSCKLEPNKNLVNHLIPYKTLAIQQALKTTTTLAMKSFTISKCLIFSEKYSQIISKCLIFSKKYSNINIGADDPQKNKNKKEKKKPNKLVVSVIYEPWLLV